jgi:hypothetical protein
MKEMQKKFPGLSSQSSLSSHVRGLRAKSSHPITSLHTSIVGRTESVERIERHFQVNPPEGIFAYLNVSHFWPLARPFASSNVAQTSQQWMAYRPALSNNARLKGECEEKLKPVAHKLLWAADSRPITRTNTPTKEQ